MGKLIRLRQCPHIGSAAPQQRRVHCAGIEVHRLCGEQILIAAALPVQPPQQIVQRGAEAVSGGGDGLPAVGAAQQVEQQPCGVHRQLLLQRGHDAPPQGALLRAAVVQHLRVDHRAIPVGGAAQQKVRRHPVKVTHPAHEGQTRLPYAVFIVTQQRLTDAQRRRCLPLADALLLPQQAQCSGKIRCHVSLPPYLVLAPGRIPPGNKIQLVKYILFYTACKCFFALRRRNICTCPPEVLQ